MVSHDKKYQSFLESKIKIYLHTIKIYIRDESHLHIGHETYNTGINTHFFIQIVSDDFQGLNLLMRHRKVYSFLKQEFKSIHALRMSLLTSKEYYRNSS